jgi:hypothetical protein
MKRGRGGEGGGEWEREERVGGGVPWLITIEKLDTCRSQRNIL